MILVDTSILIDYLKGLDNTHTRAFDGIIEKKIPFGINDFIYQEVLQGSRTVQEFRKLKEYLETLPFYGLRHGKESYERAAYLNFACRESGITIRSSIDLLIAQTAIENDIFLFHHDGDFTNMATVIKELKIYKA